MTVRQCQRDRAKVFDLFFFQTAFVGAFLFFLCHEKALLLTFFSAFPVRRRAMHPFRGRNILNFMKIF